MEADLMPSGRSTRSALFFIACLGAGLLASGAEPGGTLTMSTGNSLMPLGLVDVTAAPFGADSTGGIDATAAIRQAMTAARKRKSAVFFPTGTYRVSDTLESALDMRLVRQGEDSPSLLIGSRAATGRPKIVLAPGSPGFADPDSPKAVLHLWSRSRDDSGKPQPNINYNQVVVNLDIEIAPGNPGAVGIHHDAAQGSGIEDVTIDAGDGFAGIVGLQAGGGGTHNVTVIGGRYGIDASGSLATAATISGCTFLGQRVGALRYNGLETLCLVGARIVVPAGASGPAIHGVGTAPTRGTMAIVDTQIEFEGQHPENVAVGSNRSVYLHNVWILGARAAVRAGGANDLPAAAKGWFHVTEFARGVRPPPLDASKGGMQLEHVSYVDGVRVSNDVFRPGRTAEAPPADLQSRHVWEPPVGWGTPGIANVKQAPYSAKGDSTTDDTAALQRAIDENEVLFLPKGRYNVTRTLRLRPNTVLIGLRQMSVLVATRGEGGDFSDPDDPRPVVQSADSADGKAALAYVGIAAQDDIPALLLHWRTGRDSVVRSIFAGTNRGYQRRPVLISGNGGGRWYSLFKEARLAVEGTTQPLRFYQANPEWGSKPHMIIRNARDVTIYGLKEEGPTSLWITDSDRVQAFGYGGIANASPGKSLFLVERTPNVRLAGLVDRTFREGTPPGRWHMLREVPQDGAPVLTAPLDRIVLYRRGFGEE